MATYNNLHKYFVLVPSTATNFNGQTESEKTNKIYFDQTTNTIWARGTQYGASPETLARIAALEGIHVKDADDVAKYLTITDSDSKEGTITPEVTVKVVKMEDAKAAEGETPAVTGLADAADVKAYVDNAAAKGTTEVVQAAGVTVTSSTDSEDNHTIYTVGANLVFEYNAAVAASEGVDAKPATITLKSAVRADETQVTYGTVNVSDIIGNGLLDSSSYDDTTGLLTLNFKQADGTTKAETVDLKAMLDINDMSIAAASKDYLDVTLTGTGEANGSQAVFGAKIVTMENAKAASGEGDDAVAAVTGLADALDVKTYVDSKTTGSVKDVTASAGTRGTWAVTDAGVASLDGETAPSISGVADSLMDGAQAITAVKTYVDAKAAVEAAERAAKIEAAVKALDVTETEVKSSESNPVVSFKYSETDGKVAISNLVVDIATAKYTAATPASGEGENAVVAKPANLAINTDEKSTALLTGASVEAIKSYVDAMVSSNVDSLDADFTGDNAAKSTSTNVTVSLKEENGVITTLGVATQEVTATWTADETKHVAFTKIAADDTTKLLQAGALNAVVDYIDDFRTEVHEWNVWEDWVDTTTDSTKE